MAKTVAPKAPNMSDDERKWRARDDMRTLSQAEEIRADKARMREAAKCAAEEMRKLASIKNVKIETAPKTIRMGK